MEKNGVNGLCIIGLYVCFAALLLVQCDATKTIHRYKTRKHFPNSNTKPSTNFHFSRKFDLDMPSNVDPYVSSPLSTAPFDSPPPISLPENAPSYCVDPPFTPLPPSTIPGPMGYSPPFPPASSFPILPGPIPIPNPPTSPNPPIIIPTPPNPPSSPNPPIITPTPPNPPSSPNPPIIIPTPPSIVPNPPTDVPTPTQPMLSPPYYEPSPPYNNVPSPGPRSKFLPPNVYPPPIGPPPYNQAPPTTLWCVAKPSVPDPIIQEAMNYACGSGADCNPIQSGGLCYQPNTLFAHASYAFNSYWQRTKTNGGTCSFGGTAILVTVDPSYDGCHFDYY